MTQEEHKQAFEAFMQALKYDFMYMGKDLQFYYFKHAETRKGIQIPINQEP